MANVSCIILMYLLDKKVCTYIYTSLSVFIKKSYYYERKFVDVVKVCYYKLSNDIHFGNKVDRNKEIIACFIVP